MKNIKKIAKEILSKNIVALEGYNYNKLTIIADEIQKDVVRGFERVDKGLKAIKEIETELKREKAVGAELDADFERLRKNKFEEQIRKVEDISRSYPKDQENLKNMVDQLRNSIYTIAGK